MRRTVRVMALAGLALWTVGAGGAVTPETVTDQVRGTYQRLQGLSADFDQTTTVPGFETELRSKGRVYLAKGKMRWDYTEPSTQQIYVNDRRIEYFIPAHKQVIVSTLTPENDDQIPLHLLMTLERLGEDFTVSWEDPTAPRRGDEYRLRLDPNRPVAGLDYARVGVDTERGVVTSVSLHPKNGNVSAFVFSRLKVNPPVDSALFTLTVPPGIEVVETPTLR